MFVAFQLALTGLHELSEARWLPSSKQEMALIGPIVRNEVFFFVVIFGAAALLILREWQSASRAKAEKDAGNEAERRLLESQNRRAKSWMMAASVACLAVVLVLSADFAYTRANSASPAARPIAAIGNEVRVPLSDVQDSNMHLFTVELGGQALRFMVIKKPSGYGTALDACRICGAEGYRQDGQNVVCRHCASAIYIPSIGDQGGCNPVGVASHIDGADLVMDLTSLTKAASEVPK